MKKKKILLILSSITLSFFIIGFISFDSIINILSNSKSSSSGYTQEFDNGDYTYIPSDNDIMFEDIRYISYYKNLLTVNLTDELSNSQKKGIANIIDAEIVGELKGSLNMLQLKVDGKSLNELETLATKLKDDGKYGHLISYATHSTPIKAINIQNMDGN